jgi:hypothetical protein
VSPPGKLPEDLNADGAVNVADIAFLMANYGKATSAKSIEGDLDGDGRIGVRDAIALRNAFTPSPAAAVVARAHDRAIVSTPGDSELMRVDRRGHSSRNDLPRISPIATDQVLAAGIEEPNSLMGRRSRLLARTRR